MQGLPVGLIVSCYVSDMDAVSKTELRMVSQYDHHEGGVQRAPAGMSLPACYRASDAPSHSMTDTDHYLEIVDNDSYQDVVSTLMPEAVDQHPTSDRPEEATYHHLDASVVIHWELPPTPSVYESLNRQTQCDHDGDVQAERAAASQPAHDRASDAPSHSTQDADHYVGTESYQDVVNALMPDGADQDSTSDEEAAYDHLDASVAIQLPATSIYEVTDTPKNRERGGRSFLSAER